MATKASSKTATRKPAASAAGRKTTAPQKPVHVAPKAKVPKKAPAAPAEPTAPAKQLKSQPGVAIVFDRHQDPIHVITDLTLNDRHVAWSFV